MTRSPATGDTPDWPDLPATLAARPRDTRRGLPIPPVNEHPDASGGGWHVDFTTINTTTATRLAIDRRCSLCSEPMDYWVAFLGGPHAAELMQYADPPGHPECMAAAVTLCPYIAIGRHRRARGDRPGAGMMPPGSHGDKPDRFLLGTTRTYRTRFIPEHGYTVYFPAPFKSVRVFVYGPDGRLRPAPGNR